MANPVLDKSYLFSVRVVKACKYLRQMHSETVMSKQLLRSGTSIGANIAEAQEAQSTADFITKLNIALKEASESEYWIRLLYDTGYFTEPQFRSIHMDCLELKRLLSSIIHTLNSRK